MKKNPLHQHKMSEPKALQIRKICEKTLYSQGQDGQRASERLEHMGIDARVAIQRMLGQAPTTTGRVLCEC